MPCYRVLYASAQQASSGFGEFFMIPGLPSNGVHRCLSRTSVDDESIMRDAPVEFLTGQGIFHGLSALSEAQLARRAPTVSPGCGGRSLPSCGPIFRVGGKSPDGEFHIAAGNAGLPS